MSAPEQEAVPHGVVGTPQGNVPYVNISSQDYARLVFSAPYYFPIAIAEIIQPSVTEAVQAILPSLVPPYVQDAANNAVAALAVPIGGGAMTGPLLLSPTIPTAPSMAASMAYVQSMVATVVPEVPPVPSGQAWARETGQWIPLAGGGTVTNIATGAGLTGGPITATGTISMANMAANSLKGNNTGAVAAPTDISAGNVLTMIGAAPLNSPNFTGSPSLPTGTAAITQTGGTANTTVATTAFVANSLGSYAPIASPVFTGAPSLPTGSIGVTQTAGTSNTSLATTAFVAGAITTATGNYLPLTGGRLSGGLASGPAATTVPGPGALTLNQNTVASPSQLTGAGFMLAGPDTGAAIVEVDSFGGSGSYFVGYGARGTAAARTAVQLNDNIMVVSGVGRVSGTAYGGFNPTIDFQAAENWTPTAQGSKLTFVTTLLGTTTVASSLILQGNTATFSGTATFAGQIQITGGTGYAYFSNGNARFGSDGTNAGVVMPAGAGFFAVQNSTLATNFLLVDSGGNLQISGATATKASGTTWANPSARDLKENIKPYAQGLDAILALQPRTYSFAADSGIDAAGEHIGLVHDETSHMPEMHRTATLAGKVDAPGREVDALDCSAITFAMINAFKTIDARLTALEGRHDA